MLASVAKILKYYFKLFKKCNAQINNNKFRVYSC